MLPDVSFSSGGPSFGGPYCFAYGFWLHDKPPGFGWYLFHTVSLVLTGQGLRGSRSCFLLMVIYLLMNTLEMEKKGQFSLDGRLFYIYEVPLKVTEKAEDIGQALELGKFVALVEEHYKEHRETVFYAKKLGMRSRNLNGLVKITFGQGVFGVVMDRMMLEAEVLLLETTMAMKEVAYELGFSELSYFSTYFKRRKGMSPMEFRVKGNNKD